MAIYRRLTNEDWPKVLELYEKYHSNLELPNPKKNVVQDAIISEGDRILAYGTVQLFGEGVMILDPSLPLRLRVQILKRFMFEAITSAKRYGLDTLHVFSEDESYRNLLKKHYGFVDLRHPGIVLPFGVDNGQQ